MPDHTTADAQRAHFVATMAERMATLTRSLSDWGASERPTLERMEQHLLRTLQDLAATLLSGLAQLAVPAEPVATVPCACGGQARYQRQRPATVKTVVGPITLTRPSYLCAVCHQGQAPLPLPPCAVTPPTASLSVSMA